MWIPLWDLVFDAPPGIAAPGGTCLARDEPSGLGVTNMKVKSIFSLCRV
jgi:hypothetical protein